MLGSYARQSWKVFILILALLITCLPSCFVINGVRFWRTCCFLNGACFSVTLWIFWLVYHKRGGLHINFLVKKIISRSIKNCWTSHAASNKHSSIMISSQAFVTTKITEWHGVRFQEEATIHYQQYLFILLERYLSCIMFKILFAWHWK